MMGVQKLGARINQLQQAEDFAGAESLYGQVCFLSCFLMGHPALSADWLKHSVFQFNAAVSSLVRPPHQFYVIAGRSHASCLWVRWGNKVRYNTYKYFENQPLQAKIFFCYFQACSSQMMMTLEPNCSSLKYRINTLIVSLYVFISLAMQNLTRVCGENMIGCQNSAMMGFLTLSSKYAGIQRNPR